jgi:hypothetical protein
MNLKPIAMNNLIYKKIAVWFLFALLSLSAVSSEKWIEKPQTDTTGNNDSFYLKPFYTRFSLLTPAITIEKTLFSPAHTVFAEYSGYNLHDIMTGTNGNETGFAWPNHLITGYRWYFNLNKRIDENKRYFNYNSFYADIHHTWTPYTKGVSNYSAVGISIGSQLTYKYFYGSLSYSIDNKYEFADKKLSFYSFSLFPEIRLGVFLPYSKVPDKTLEKHAPYFGFNKKKSEPNNVDLDKFHFRINVLYPGINIEKSILDIRNTMSFDFKTRIMMPGTFLAADIQVSNFNALFPHVFSLNYNYYYNLDKRLINNKQVRNYQANFFRLRTEIFTPLLFSVENPSVLYGTGIQWGGNISFNKFLYMNYEIGPVAYFYDGNIILFDWGKAFKPINDFATYFTIRTDLTFGFYF